MRWFSNHEIFFGDVRGKTLNGLPGGREGDFGMGKKKSKHKILMDRKLFVPASHDRCV